MSILPIFDIIGTIVNKVIPDPQARMAMQLELSKLADAESARDHESDMGQIEVNKIEAASTSLFVAGWRPFIGWGSGSALLYNTMIAPALHLGVADLGFLQTVLMAILGLGAMRSYDKVKDTASDAPLIKPVIDALRPKRLPLNIPGL